MEAIGLNPIRLDRIGLDPIRVNAIKLGVPGTASGSARPYIDPEVLASLVAVCICDGKSNDDPDRAVIKNLVDPDNPFVISNAAYKLNSGYGKYEEDFTDTTRWEVVSGVNKKPYELQVTTAWNPKIDWIALIKGSGDLKSVSLNVSGIPNEGTLFFYYGTDSIQLYNGNNKVTLSGAIPQTTSGYRIIKGRDLDWSNLVITQIPSHQGALVTDGVDDLIVSQKTSLEMIGGDNRPFTVISMISVINNSRTYYNNMVGTTNMNLSVVNSTVLGKTGIFGYTSTELNTNPSVVNNILGDKNDYSTRLEGASSPVDRRFSVTGYLRDGTPTNVSSIAWYWTFIANKALTTDQINQVISYFNLDKHVKPDVYYDVKKQGLSNDTPEADWYLKDFSGNGHDMQLYNFAKKLDSGIGKYKVDFNTWIPQSYVADSTYTSNKLHITNIKGGNAILYTKKGTNAMKVKITGIQSFNLVYRYIAENDVWEALEVDRDGIYELPASTTTTKNYYTGFTVPYYTGDCDITIEQIPDYEGALVFDAVDDYGQFVGDLGLEDYTIAVDRAYVEAKPSQVPIMSNVVDGSVSTPFLMEHIGIEKILAPHSFGTYTVLSELDINRFISYQSTYKYNGIDITKGTSTNTGSGLTIGRIGGVASQYANIALWSLLLFPYSLSEFLLERQLKRYKLGTLYPNMVEFRPIVKSNREYSSISYSVNPGEYISVDSMVTITVTLPNTSDKLIDVSCNAISDISISGDNGVYKITGKVVKSPQKIGIAIESDV